MSWHTNNPLTKGNSWDISSNNVVESVLPGGVNYNLLNNWINTLANFIESLKTEEGIKIPVLFRPWHEHTGSWFWWGQKLCDKEHYKMLWSMVYQCFNERGIDNVLYAYSPGIEPTTDAEFLERYPGDEMIDLLGFDFYQSRDGDYVVKMNQMLKLLTAIGAKKQKPIAITETGFGAVPDSLWWTKTLLPFIENYPVSYVLVWRNTDKLENHYFAPFPGQKSEKDFVDFYNTPNTLFIKDLKQLTLEK